MRIKLTRLNVTQRLAEFNHAIRLKLQIHSCENNFNNSSLKVYTQTLMKLFSIGGGEGGGHWDIYKVTVCASQKLGSEIRPFLQNLLSSQIKRIEYSNFQIRSLKSYFSKCYN